MARHLARSIRRRRRWAGRPLALLLGCGLLLGLLVGLSLRDIIRESYANGRIGALLGTGPAPVAAMKPVPGREGWPQLACCSTEAANYEIGYSYASAMRIERVERCETLPPAFVSGCTAYARAPRPASKQDRP